MAVLQGPKERVIPIEVACSVKSWAVAWTAWISAGGDPAVEGWTKSSAQHGLPRRSSDEERGPRMSL